MISITGRSTVLETFEKRLDGRQRRRRRFGRAVP